MADRVHPAAKPVAPPPAAAAAGAAPNGNGAAAFPAPKSYQRPIYRPPQAPPKRRRRSCRCGLCCCLCWSLLALIVLAFLAAVAGGIFYLLYRPQRPSFAVSSVRLAALNLTSSATAPALTDSILLTVTARNPNKKLVFVYDDFSLSAATAANAVPLGTATVPGFAQEPGNTTVVAANVAAAGVPVDPTAAGSDLKKSGGFSVVFDAETRAGVRVGSLKTKKIGIKVHCEGIKVTPPAPPPPAPKKVAGKNGTVLAPAPAPSDAADTTTTTTVSTAAHWCKVTVRVKIWKLTF